MLSAVLLIPRTCDYHADFVVHMRFVCDVEHMVTKHWMAVPLNQITFCTTWALESVGSTAGPGLGLDACENCGRLPSLQMAFQGFASGSVSSHTPACYGMRASTSTQAIECGRVVRGAHSDMP